MLRAHRYYFVFHQMTNFIFYMRLLKNDKEILPKNLFIKVNESLKLSQRLSRFIQ